jgi:hypothetical protein
MVVMLNKPTPVQYELETVTLGTALKRYDDDAPPMKDVKLSRIDPDSGFMARDDKPAGFCC